MEGWSQERPVWNALRSKIGPNKWHRAPFDSSKAFLVAEEPGIYAICARAPFGTGAKGPLGAYKPMYIGRAARENGGLRARFLEHTRHPKPSIRAMVRCFHDTVEFWYVKIESKELIQELEALCLEAFGPECNDVRAPHQNVILATLGKSVPA